MNVFKLAGVAPDDPHHAVMGHTDFTMARTAAGDESAVSRSSSQY